MSHSKQTGIQTLAAVHRCLCYYEENVQLNALQISNATGLVKVAGVAPTELQELKRSRSLNLLPNLNRDGLVVPKTLGFPEVLIALYLYVSLILIIFLLINVFLNL